jgi:DNA polymerase III alpha subunit
MDDAQGLPQLRVRTEHSFRRAFGPARRVVAGLQRVGARFGGIVDSGTWGHVSMAKTLNAEGIAPLFGSEFEFPAEDGRTPSAWALAADASGFYRMSTAARAGAPEEAFAAAAGAAVRFAGVALTDPELFDFVDVNPSSPIAGRRALELARRTGRPLALTSNPYYPAPTDASAFAALVGGGDRVAPQHIMSEAELRRAMPWIADDDFRAAVAGAYAAAERCCTRLPKASVINVPGDIRALAEEGRRARLAAGRIAAWTPEYAARLERELTLVAEKGYASYFIVVADLIHWAKQRMLVGPGRGSSAGSLLCFLTGITEVDPLPHGLLFERFIDVTRNDLPDIDIDFSDVKRDQCFDYLRAKYGDANVARIGNINTYKPRSLLAEVCKRFAIPDHERFALVNVLVEYSSGDSRYGKGLEDTLQNTEVGRAFLAKYPEASAVLADDIENHASHTGVHAAGVIVANEPVGNYCTIVDGLACVDKPAAEALGLLKIDVLGLRTLGVIEDAGVVTGEELYALTLDDPEVFRIFNDHKYGAIFQFEGASQRSISKAVTVDSFRIVDHLTALARPGPLGGGATQKYINRKAGTEQVRTAHATLDSLLAETYGVVLYQEQVMRMVREMGKFSWEDTTMVRKGMSGRKGTEFFDRMRDKFVAGAAVDGIAPDVAVSIWKEICTFGAWGMNKSHTTAYAVISYWCAWMKRYHPLAYAAACLRNAKDDEHAVAVLREMVTEGVHYTPFDIDRSQENWTVVEGELIGGFRNLVGVGPAKARAAVLARAAGKLNRERFLALPVKFVELYPLRKLHAELYDDPERFGCRAGSRITFGDELPEDGDVLYLGRVAEKQLLDVNETVRVQRRGGKRMTGQPLFVDLVCKDDTGVPIRCRIGRFDYARLGVKAMTNIVAGEDDVLVRGRRVPGFQMIHVERIRCLNAPEKLQ